MAGRAAAGSGARRPDGFAGGVALKWARRMWARRPPPSPQRGGEHRSRSAARRAGVGPESALRRRARRHDSGAACRRAARTCWRPRGRGAARPGFGAGPPM